MRGKRFTEKQIIKVLKEHQAGARVADLVHKHHVSEQSIYRWRAKYGGMKVSEIKRMLQLERKHRQLTRQLAEARRDKAALEELLRKKW